MPSLPPEFLLATVARGRVRRPGALAPRLHPLRRLAQQVRPVVLAAAALAAQAGGAQTWSGSSPFSSFVNDPFNWVGSVAPVSGADTLLTFRSSGRAAPNFNLPSGGGAFVLRGLSIESGAPGYSFSGRTLSFASGGSITDASALTQTFQNGVTTQGSLTLRVDAGLLNLAGGLTSDATPVFTTPDVGKTGAGVLALGGSSTYHGLFNLYEGTLRVDNAAAVAGARLTVWSGALLNLTGVGTVSLPWLQGGGNVDLGTGTLTLAIADGRAEYSGRLTGSGALVKSGAGTQRLSGVNFFTGSTAVNAGTLELAHPQALAGSVVTVNVDGGLDLGSLSAATLGGLGGGGAVDIGSRTLTLDIASNQAPVYSGALTGSGTLVKTGLGRQTLSGAAGFSGTTRLQGGKLVLGSANVLARSVVEFGVDNALDLNGQANVTLGGLAGSARFSPGASNVTLDVAAGAAPSYAGSLGGSGRIVKRGAGSQTLAGDGAGFTGTLEVAEGRLRLASRTALVGASLAFTGDDVVDLSLSDTSIGGLDAASGRLTIGAGRTLTIGAGGRSSRFGGTLASADLARPGTLVKAGAGTLTLDGLSDSFVGGTTVSGGAIQLALEPLALRRSVVTLLTANGLKPGALAGFTVGGLAGNASLALGSAQPTFELAAGVTAAYTGALSGSGGLVKAGAGTQAFGSLANPLTGTVRVTDGVLRVDAPNTLQATTLSLEVNDGLAFGTSSAVFAGLTGSGRLTLASGATFTVNNTTDQRFAGALRSADAANPGVFVKQGSGRLQLDAASPDFAGTLRLRGGVLAPGHGSALAGAVVDLGVDRGLALDAAGGSVTLGGLTGSSLLELGSGVLRLAPGAGRGTGFAGRYTGSGQLVKVGDGSQVFSGAGSGFTGTVVVAGGALGLASAAATQYTVTAGELVLGSAVKGGAAANVAAGGRLAWSRAALAGATLGGAGVHDVSGITTLSDVQVGADARLDPADTATLLRVTNRGTLGVAAGRSLLWSSGGQAGGRTEVAGVLTLGSTWSGTGVLAVQAGGQVNTLGSLTLGAGSRLDLAGAGGALAGGALSLASGARLVVDGATVANDGRLSGPAELRGGALAEGSGTWGALLLGGGAVLSPGHSPGGVTSADTTWASGGVYRVEVADAAGGYGQGWDGWTVDGALAITAGTGADAFRIDLRGLGAGGLAAGFDPHRAWHWTVLQASGGITGYDPGRVVLDASGFGGGVGLAGGQWGLRRDGGTLTVDFTPAATPVPEPSQALLLAGGLALLWRGRRLHRR